MKDKSKRLTVVNTEKKKPQTNDVVQQVVVPASSSSHAPGFNPNLYLLKSVWDSVFEIKTDVSGQKYIFGKLPVVTKYGITMYADDGNVDIPQLAEGLPFDQRTIWFNPETKQIEVIGGTGGGEGGVSNFWDLSGIPSWITNSKPIYNYSEIKNTPDLSVFVTGTALSNTLADYATLSYLTGELKKYVTLDGAQDIKGVKNFVNGLKIANMPITKLQDDVIYIDANLVVRGGVTMYYQDGEVDLPSIIDEIGIAGYDGKKLGLASFSSSQFLIDANGNVTIKGGSTGLDTAQLKDYLDSNKYTTETWVKAQGYASASSLSSLQTKVNNFLEGSDTDTIINKWKELEAFLSGLSESDNLATILSTKWTTDNNLINQWNAAYGWGNHASVGYALKSYVDKTFVTIAGNEDVIGVHDFVNGLKIGNIKLSKSQNDVLYIDGNLVVRGGVTMYAENEVDIPSIIDSLPIANANAQDKASKGIASFDSAYFKVTDGWVTLTSAPSSVSTIGSLQDVSPSVSGTTNSDVVLFKSANSNTWTTKPLSEIGGGGGSVSGNYLPLSGGTIVGSGDYNAIPLVIKNGIASFSGINICAYNTERVHLGYFGSLGGIRLENLINNYGFAILDDGTPSFYKSYSDGTFTKNTILHTGNYSSYALPLTRAIYHTNGDNPDPNTWDGNWMGMTNQNTPDGTNFFHILSSNWGNATQNNHKYWCTQLALPTVVSNHIFYRKGSSETTFNRWVAVLDDSNVGSYALPISGGTLTGDLTTSNGVRLFLNTGGDGIYIYNEGISFHNSSNNWVASNIGFYSNGSVSLCPVGGYVGIRTTSPSRELHVKGSMVTEGGSIEAFQSVDGIGKYAFIKINEYYTHGNEEWASYIVSDYYGTNWCTTGGFTHGMYFKSGRYQFDNFIFLDSSGNPIVRLSSANTGMGHHFMGNALFTGGITMYSDIRKKTKLQDVELSLSQIANAPLIQHYYNSDDSQTTHVGSIAQYWAGLNDWFCKLDNEGYYTMEIQNCALASAISIARHLEKYESKTDKKIRQLKKRISQLEDELELLKKGV